jgi:hypothetical protein
MFDAFFSQVKDKVLLSEAEQKLVKTFFSNTKQEKKSNCKRQLNLVY